MAASIDGLDSITDHHYSNEFFGVYLLYSLNPRYKGRIYIGFTVDPNRRIHQHNTGHHAGGACRTSGRGPWEMLMITYGFPNAISALRFEWAWQNPDKSRRVRAAALETKSKKETGLQYRIRVLGAMLNSGPWNRLALSVRWLRPEFSVPFPAQLRPPPHMRLFFGALALTASASGRLESRPKKHTSQKARRRLVRATDAGSARDESEMEMEMEMESESAQQSSCPVRLTRCTICKQSLHASDADLRSGASASGAGSEKQDVPCASRVGRTGRGMPQSTSIRFVLCPTAGCMFQSHMLCCANACRPAETEAEAELQAGALLAACDPRDAPLWPDSLPLIPLRVRCPLCKQSALWGDMLRYSRFALMPLL